MDSKNKNFDDIRRLSQSIEIKSKILEKYLNHFNEEEIDFINNSIKYRNKFDNEILNQNPNLELYINGFNSINNTLNGFIEYLKENNLYISENNMKHSELKQIIKEEIRSVLNEEPQSKNTFRPILLPTISGEPSYTEVPTFEKYAQWRAKFKSTYGEYPEFDKSNPNKWKVTNPKFLEKQGMYTKAIEKFGTKGD